VARVVTTDEIVLAPSWRHQIEDGHARTELLLHDGSEICSDKVGVVFNRLLDVGMSNFAASKREDRDYATMEMFALLLSWLSALACPVVNSPSPQGLAGATRHPALWLAMAARAGLPVLRIRITTSTRRFADPALSWVTPGDRPAWQYEPVERLHCSALVTGSEVHGCPSPELVKPCRHLAALCGLRLLRVDFCQTPKRPWVCIGADPCPDVADEAGLSALVRLLEESARTE
jgi:hypothetical protein